MVVGLGQGVHDQGMELPLFVHHRLCNLICHLPKEVDLQRIDRGPVYCREIRDSLLVEMMSIPHYLVCEFGEMVRGPTCHPVLNKLGFEGSEVRRICAILTCQDRVVLSGEGSESWRSIVQV